jgi:ADP-heptose:LPS heptosyltransferase
LKVKFLIIRFSSIGDIVLTSPVVRCLKNQVKNAEVHFVTKSRYAHLVNSNPYIDKVHLLGGSMGELKARLQKENFDYVIDLHKNFRSNRVRRFLKVPSYVFNKLNIEKYIYVNFKINRLPDCHIVDRNLFTLKNFNVTNDNRGLDFFIPEGQDYDKSQLPEFFRKGYIAFVIGGTWNTKKLPVHKVADICNSIPYPVILLGGKNEQEQGVHIKELTTHNVLDMTGKITLYNSASLVRDAQLVLTNDTGLMHIAAAYKKKILSFWGNTVPLFGMYPYMADTASEHMEVEGLSCRPCSKIGYRKCPNKHFRCMENQDTERVVQWINQYFKDVVNQSVKK